MGEAWPWPGRLAFGADYNPEQWTPATQDEDLDLMVEAGVNLVTLAVFSWSRLEPEPGVFDFEWLDRVIDRLWSRGVHVDLATATATPPAWLVRRHPEVLPVTADGTQLEFGSRQTYCPSSPIFRQHAVRLSRELARHYRDHPALALWHVSNEYGDELSRCYCDVSTERFRAWLQHRYSDLAALNQAWGTDVWGQRYSQWGQIAAPRKTAAPVNPAQRLDFERFSSDELIELLRAEVAVLRAECPNVLVTTNFMGLFRDVDYWRMADSEDVVSNDAYPDPADAASHVSAALGFALMRSLKPSTPWLLMEQAPGAVSWRAVNAVKPPGQMRLTSLQALAHGADGIMFFQWRASRAGAERFHSALVGHRGPVGRTWSEARDLGRELRGLGEIAGSRVIADVGLLVGWDSWWALDAGEALPSVRFSWLEQVRVWHEALFRLGITVELVNPDCAQFDHRMLVAPNLFLQSAEQAERLERYVESGGHLVVGPFSGVVDETNAVHLGGAPGPLRDLLGVTVDEWCPLPDEESQVVAYAGAKLDAVSWTESLERTTATVAGTYERGWLAGRPAVTVNRVEKGSARYISLVAPTADLEVLLRDALESAGIKARAQSSADVEFVTRRGAHATYLFVLNHTANVVDVDVPTPSVDMLTGRREEHTMTLLPRGAAVLRSTVQTNQEQRCV
ncbi:MAG TPA: beta-galactosidase [Mycobacteriales bacterium]|nr:beta-galactosidase [Mycobacteriales bacterium]